jgi:hypothetical protein
MATRFCGSLFIGNLLAYNLAYVHLQDLPEKGNLFVIGRQVLLDFPSCWLTFTS